VAGTGGIQVLAEHDAPGLLETELFLELQGAHRRDRLEVVVKARDAHPEIARQGVDPQRLVEVTAEPLDGFRDAVGGAAQERQVTEPVALVSHQQPVDDLPRDQRAQNPCFGGRAQEPHQADRGIQQAGVERADIHRPNRPHVVLVPCREMARLHHHRADESRVELVLSSRAPEPLRWLSRNGLDLVTRTEREPTPPLLPTSLALAEPALAGSTR
jgi:hypothetical protein